MVFDKIDINGDGKELSYAMPNTAPTSPLPAIPDVGCPKTPGHRGAGRDQLFVKVSLPVPSTGCGWGHWGSARGLAVMGFGVYDTQTQDVGKGWYPQLPGDCSEDATEGGERMQDLTDLFQMCSHRRALPGGVHGGCTKGRSAARYPHPQPGPDTHRPADPE